MKWTVITAILLALTGFYQNCSETLKPAADPGGTISGDRVVGPAGDYDQIAYQSAQFKVTGGQLTPSPRLDIDLTQATLTITDRSTQAVHSCAMEDTRLESLRAILAGAKVCEPGPLPPGTVTCMAASMPDVFLSNGSSTVELARPICHYGRYLCDGKDDQLRAWITDLLAHLPSGC